MGQLDVTGWGFLALLGGVAFLAWWRFVRRRGRRHHWMTLLGSVLLTLLLAADSVNSYFSDLPHVADLVSVVTGNPGGTQLNARDLQVASYAEVTRKAPHGGVVRLPVADRGSGFGRSTALVYLPPQYFTEPSRHFPVVYLLHGSPGSPADWLRGGGAAATGTALAAEGKPALIVMPRMSHHWLDDPECVDGVRLKDETHLLADVLPASDSTFRTAPGPAGRIIAGMSAGGYCALNLGLRHPDLFGTIVDMSGLDRPTHRGGDAALFGPGPSGAVAAAANSPSVYASRLPYRMPVRIWLDAGRSDGAVLPGLERLDRVLDSRGIDVRLTVRPGAHTYRVWRPALRQALQAMLPAS